MIEISLLGPPQGKARVRFNRATGSAYTPERTVNYEGRLALAAQEAMTGQNLLLGPLSVSVQALVPIPASWSNRKKQAAESGELRPTGKPDLDNYAKMLDALNMIVWNDDSQIVELLVTKRYSPNPAMHIRVWSIGTELFG